MLLNSKPILECNEFEEERHLEEIELIAEKIYALPNYDCAVVFKYTDPAHYKNKETIKSCYIHDFLDMVEYTDFKNGIDIEISDDKVLTVVAYGQFYTLNEEYFNVITNIYFLPYNEDKEFLDISSYVVL